DRSFEVEDGLEVAQRTIEDVPDTAGQSLEEPHVRTRRSQFDVAEALAAHFRERHFDAALVADHAAVLHAFVLAAQALPVGDRAKDTRAEQAIALRLEGAVVDGLRLGYFPVRPAPDLLRRSQANADRVEIGDWVSELKWIRTVQIVLLPCGSRLAGCRVPRPLRGRWRLPISIDSPGAASCGSSGGNTPILKISRRRPELRSLACLRPT